MSSIRVVASLVDGGEQDFAFGPDFQRKLAALDAQGLRLGKACKAAGVPGRLVHALRRTAARDFRRSGVSEGEIMQLCGWKTRDMFDRYNIIDDRRRAVARRFGTNGKGTANIEAPVSTPA